MSFWIAVGFRKWISFSGLNILSPELPALHEMRRVVRPGGEINVAFFSAGTLAELHACFREVSRVRSPDDTLIASRLHGFRGVDEVTAIVKQFDFKRFVITVETEVDWYDDLHSLLNSIRNIGAGSVSGGSGSGLGWRGILNETARLYQERYGKDGLIPVTYKVLRLTASV